MTVSSLLSIVNPQFWGYVKWNLHFKNNCQQVFNPMKQSARELIECGINYIRPEDSYAVGSTVLKAFRNKRFKTVEAGATRLCSVPHPPTRTCTYW